MTSQESLEQIAQLLLTYPGMASAVVFRLPAKEAVHIRFRCTEEISIRSIAVESGWANVRILLGDPNRSMCVEPEDACALPCDITIPDTETQPPTHVERFGVYIAVNLAEKGLISEKRLQELHARWNTRLAGREYPPIT